jgi:hypothetical protein
MPVEVTRFDSFLKEKLYRDILFRAAVWLAIAALTARVATARLSSVEYLAKLSASLMPVLVQIMWATLILSIPALILKELEFVSPERWQEDSPAVMLGGAVRRLAGDLSLWVLGAIVTLLGATAFLTSDVLFERTPGAVGFLAVVWVAGLFGMALMSAVNIYVRRAEPIFAGSKGFEWVTKSSQVLALYGFILVASAIGIRFS